MTEAAILGLVQQHGYWMIFLISIIEGPIVSLVGGFLASLGILNFLAVYLIILSGDFIGDSLYYAFGWLSRDRVLDSYGKHIGLPQERLQKLDKIFRHHGGKTLLVTKFLFIIGGFFLVSAGASRMHYGKFVFYNIIGTIVKAALLVGLGYYFGSLYMVAAKQFQRGTEILTIIILLIAVVTFIGKKALTRFIYKLD